MKLDKVYYTKDDRKELFFTVMLLGWISILCLNLFSHNWPAAFNAGAVIFYLFVTDRLKNQIKEVSDGIHDEN